MEPDYILRQDKVTTEQETFSNLIDMLDEQTKSTIFHQHSIQDN